MAVRIPLWAVLAVCAGGLAFGRVWGQGEDPKKPDEPLTLTEYPYLPGRYGQPYIPSVAEWQALRLTSLGASTTRLTDQFSRQHLTCFPDRKGLILTLDLLPEPGWKGYANGKWTLPPDRVKADLQKAVDATMSLVRAFFPEVADKNVTVQLYLKSERIGTWQEGALTLTAEKPASK